MNENNEPIKEISEADVNKKFEFDLFDFKSFYMEEVERIMDTIATYSNALEPEDENYIEKMREFSNVLQARSGVISGNYYGGSGNDSSSGGGKSGGNGGEPHEGPPDSNTKSHSDSKGADSSDSSSSHDSSSMSGQHYNQHSLHREELEYDGDTSELYHSDDNDDDSSTGCYTNVSVDDSDSDNDDDDNDDCNNDGNSYICTEKVTPIVAKDQVQYLDDTT